MGPSDLNLGDYDGDLDPDQNDSSCRDIAIVLGLAGAILFVFMALVYVCQ